MSGTKLPIFDKKENRVFRPSFNRSLRVEAGKERLTSDAGVVLMRELIDHIGIVDWMAARMCDPRHSGYTRHQFKELLLTEFLLRCQHLNDQDDADRLRNDPALRLAVSQRKGDAPLRSGGGRVPDGLPSQPTLSRFQDSLTIPQNFIFLQESIAELSFRRWSAAAQGSSPFSSLVVDVDSLPIEVFGSQSGSAYNSYYRRWCYQALLIGSAQTNDFLGGDLCPGNVFPASRSRPLIRETIRRLKARYPGLAIRLRMDAAFPDGASLDEWEASAYFYTARIKGYSPLERIAAPYLQCFPGFAPGQESAYYELTYQAGNWAHPRRVVLVIVQRGDQLVPEHFFIVTNYPAAMMSGSAVRDEYRQRGEYELRLGELMSAVRPQLSSTTRPKKHYGGEPAQKSGLSRDAFQNNAVVLCWNLLTYNLLHTGRVLAEQTGAQSAWHQPRQPHQPRSRGDVQPGMSLRRFRETILKTAGRIVITGDKVILRITESVAKLWTRLATGIKNFILPPSYETQTNPTTHPLGLLATDNRLTPLAAMAVAGSG